MATASKIRINTEVIEVTISATNIANKFITLPSQPFNPLKVTVDVIGGPAQQQFVDYIINVNTLSWNAMGLETVLSVNDRLRIVYYK